MTLAKPNLFGPLLLHLQSGWNEYLLAVELLLVAALFSAFSFLTESHLLGSSIMPSKRIYSTASLAARCGHVTKFCLV